MSTTSAGTQQGSHARHWVGLRATMDSVEVALVDRGEVALDHAEVPNDPRALLKVVKHWNRKFGFEPSSAVFCGWKRNTWSGGVLGWMTGRGWMVVLVEQDDHEPLPEDDAGIPEAERIVRTALRSTSLDLTPGYDVLRTRKVELLRSRRQKLLALRNELQEAGASRKALMEEELKREFERMDRRHVQLIDKLLQRLDTLIGLQLQDPG